ncbi:MAG: dihydrodipicolinate synthase family protein [Firmicutes bacterium]|nr:dihydrodipicolinate synthase family protein [Bacillota bacterium]
MSQSLFHGIIPPVSTIFTQEGKLDRAGMAKMIDHLINEGVHGLFFLGTGGEFSQMDQSLRLEVAEYCVKYTNGRLPVLVGIGSPGTQETINYGKHAQSIGADGVVVVNPYYVKLTEENLLCHYKKIASEINLPIMLYNFPALTGQDLHPQLVKRLVLECPNIIGIKETVDVIGHIREMIDTIKPIRPDFVVFAGYDECLLSTLIVGGAGSIPASANFAPSLTCGLYKAYQEKDYERLFELQQLISQLSIIYSMDSPFFSVIKEAIKMVGVDISTYSLPPAYPLSEEKKVQLQTILKKCNLI